VADAPLGRISLCPWSCRQVLHRANCRLDRWPPFLESPQACCHTSTRAYPKPSPLLRCERRMQLWLGSAASAKHEEEVCQLFRHRIVNPFHSTGFWHNYGQDQGYLSYIDRWPQAYQLAACRIFDRRRRLCLHILLICAKVWFAWEQRQAAQGSRS